MSRWSHGCAGVLVLGLWSACPAPPEADAGPSGGGSGASGTDGGDPTAEDGGHLFEDGGASALPDSGALELDAGAASDGGLRPDAGTLALEALADRVVSPDQTLPPIPLVITGSASGEPSVSVSAQSLGTPTPQGLPAASLRVTGTGGALALVLGPFAPQLEASYTVVVHVDDGAQTAEASFVLRINAPPSLDVVPDTATVVGFAFPPFVVGVHDDGLDATTLTVVAESSNPSFLPASGVALAAIVGGEGGRGSFELALTPASSAAVGSSDVTLTVTDLEGASSHRTFRVSVNPTATNGVELVSRTSGASPTSGNGLSLDPAVSADGGVVVFTSAASDLAGGDPSAGDLFIRDRAAGATTRLTLAGRSGAAVITPDGRFIAFVSLAANPSGAPDAGDANAVADVFVYDRTTGGFDRASQATEGERADGRSSTDGSSGGGVFRRPGLSDDGRYVVFDSEATNLVPGDTNGHADVFLRDRLAGTTTRVSVSSAGVEANGPSTGAAISGDGTVVAFASTATNLIDGETEGDSRSDVYVRALGTTSRVSSTPGGAPGGAPGNGASAEPALSTTGRFVAFSSAATDLLGAPEFYGKVDIYRLDRQAGTMRRLNLDLEPSASQGHCATPSISGDGSRVAFRSDGTFPGHVNGLINGYVLELSSDALTFVGPSLALGAPSGGTGYGLALAASGRFIVFQSPASNLFPNDLNGAIDVFLQTLP